eukprot:GHVU01188376.1.p1 GENE.GHVU01188376.1~~GHVU01188376.1.p1  ORF type:complete len:139 (-),score=4.82 GHVU01188376.1:24-440(-)
MKPRATWPTRGDASCLGRSSYCYSTFVPASQVPLPVLRVGRIYFPVVEFGGSSVCPLARTCPGIHLLAIAVSVDALQMVLDKALTMLVVDGDGADQREFSALATQDSRDVRSNYLLKSRSSSSTSECLMHGAVIRVGG